MLKCPTVIELLSFSPFMFDKICFIYLGVPMLGTVMFAEGGTHKANSVKQERFIKASKTNGMSSGWHQ